ncbi:MAG: GH25 family lysozyme [Acutalibacteraceae bacterium]
MKLRRTISALLALTMILTLLPAASAVNVFAASATSKAFKGVDVSRWNGDIDWKVMKSKGVDFAIMRCYSYGIDKKFAEYYDGASEVGIDIGAYVFMYATTKKEAVSEAKAALEALDGRALDYPLFLDIEYEKLKTMSKKALTDLCLTELEIFRNAGYDVGIYCSKNFQETYLDMTRFADYYIWTAKWSLYSTEKDSKKYYLNDIDPYDSSRPDGDLWQFSNGGYGPYYGTSGRYLDLDFCYVDFKNKYNSTTSKNPKDYTVPERELRYISSSMMRGKDVAWVQAVLYQLGLIASVDGVFTPMTKSAVLKFQKRCGLEQDGIVGPQTLRLLIDVYNHKDFSAKIKFNPKNSKSTESIGLKGYGEAFTVGNSKKYTKDGYYLSGWALYRASDKKYYCTNGNWYSSKTISSGKYIKKLFANASTLSVTKNFINSASPNGDTYTFIAQWDSQSVPKYTVYYNGYAYSTYYSTLSYKEAEKFCSSKGGALVTLKDSDELRSIKLPKTDDKFFVGATGDGEGYKWSSGKTVAFPVDSSGGNGYLTVSYSSRREPYTLFAVSDEENVSGFIMKTKCAHDNIVIENYKSTLCDTDGYSGDKVCADCKTVVESGVNVKAKGHSYGAYTVVKKATCKETGLKEKACEVCGYIFSKKIAVNDSHAFKTIVVKRATASESGICKDKCTVCGLVTKNYTVKRLRFTSISGKSFSYTGERIKPKVTVTDKDGKKLILGKDYKVSYSSNKLVGKATAVITYIGKYKGSTTRTFTITPQKTSFTSLSAGKKSVTLKWNRVAHQATGYQVQYSTRADFSKNVVSSRLTSSKTLSKTFKNLKSGRTLYFRIRTYKTVDGKNYYSAWSKVRSRTVK